MVRVQPHTEASTQLAMKGLYAVPLTKLEQVAGWIAVTRKLQSCLN
jgi:hypothetical protein